MLKEEWITRKLNKKQVDKDRTNELIRLSNNNKSSRSKESIKGYYRCVIKTSGLINEGWIKIKRYIRKDEARKFTKSH